MKSYNLLLLFALFSFPLVAQEEVPVDPVSTLTDSLSIVSPVTTLVASDSIKETKTKTKKSLRDFFKKDYPNPKKAMLLSFAIPGAGQIYNKKYWKAPFALGGTIAMIFVVKGNTENYRFLRKEYKARVDENPETIQDPRYTNWANEDIRAERDKWNKWKEMSYIGLVLIQALGGVDAFVDAHMAGFEINEDLSMKIKPSLEATTASGTALGIGLSFQLTSSSPPQPKDFFSRSY
ncbi:MAG: hypothetical protein ACI8P3_002008 [Saprospiraceae bacterium]|jgi:hypothetical protein